MKLIYTTRWSCYRVKLKQRESCQELQLSEVFEYRTILEIRDQRWDIGNWRCDKYKYIQDGDLQSQARIRLSKDELSTDILSGDDR